MSAAHKSPWSPEGRETPPIALPDRSTQISVADLKERIIHAREFTPAERLFLLTCINAREEDHESHDRGRQQA